MRESSPAGQQKPAVRIGPVASGNKVIDNLGNEFVAQIRKLWPRIIAVEMEGAGVAIAIKAVVEAGQSVGFAMIRCISDMPRANNGEECDIDAVSSQTQERDSWKTFACDAAACFAVQLVRLGWPVSPLVSQSKED